MSFSKKTILLSGATGFIGAQLAKDLSSNGIKVLCLVRGQSDKYRFSQFESKNLFFLNLDSSNFSNELEKLKPEWLIHTAWEGVSAKDRDDWSVQAKNVSLTISLLELMRKLGVKKIISFGSQAEYGSFEGRINEDRVCDPVTAYGASKVASLDILKAFCQSHSFEWYWLRLFSVYGFYEGKNWLIPSVISSVRANKPMELTNCEQRYDYLFAKDLSIAVSKVLFAKNPNPGVYNLSSNQSLQLKELILRIRDKINPTSKLNFGALPYRAHQVMHMEGDSSKFNTQFGFKVESDFDVNLGAVINHWMKNSQEN